jgi:D-3-phosphoglycerate dehydrogenase
MKKILLPERINDEALHLLESKTRVVLAKSPAENDIIEEIHDTYGIILRSAAKITRKILENAPMLKIISRTGAGYDNVDIQAATEFGIMVCNLPGINTVSVAEHTLAMMFALAKRLPVMDSYVRNGQWAKRSSYISEELSGKTLGIIGLGKIGMEVMKKAEALGLKVTAYDPYVKNIEGVHLVDSLEEIFRHSDIITVHIPQTPETVGMINRKLLGLMKKSAFIINTSRGGIIDEEALIDVLREEKIAGAGLDVFSQEPISPANPLLSMNNVILSPHTAALTKECGYKMTMEAVKQVIDAIDGHLPRYIVNRRELGL